MVRSGLSVEDRKKRLQEIKSRSKCLRCGQTGHWSGDPQCPKGRGAQQPSGKGQHQASKGGKQDSKPSPKPGPKQAFLATAVPNSSSSDDDIDCVYIDSGPSDANPQAYMHTARKVPGSESSQERGQGCLATRRRSDLRSGTTQGTQL